MTVLIALSFLGCGEAEDTAAVLPEGPALSFELPLTELLEEEALLLEVSASDEDGVASVELQLRQQGSSYWETLALEESEAGLWSITLEGEQVRAPGLEFYFKGRDASEQGAVSYLPADGSADPYAVTVMESGLLLPFTEDFEEGDDLYSMGWLSFEDGFTGYPWQITSARSAEGGQAVVHYRGYDGVPELSDWMVTPMLDFSQVDSAQVTWMELGIASDSSRHSLWISTTSASPQEEGAFEKVADLDPPGEDDWARSPLVDLSPWAGSAQVWLAWQYEGSYADDWFMDAIRVEELGADWTADLSWDPDPVWPGESADLSITLENVSPADAAEVSLSLSLPEGAGSVSLDETLLDAVASGEQRMISAELDLDPDWPENSPLALELSLEDAQGRQATLDLDMVVGLPSLAEVDLSLESGGSLQVLLGAGDPADPEFETLIYADLADPGALSLSVPLTEQHELLPAEPGARWYLTLSGEATGSLDRFQITYGGETTAAEQLAELDGAEEALVWLPTPPEPLLVSAVTLSEPLPGAELLLYLTLANEGADTSGAVTGQLLAAGEGVEVLSSDPFTLTAEAWAAGSEQQTPSIEVRIDEDHTLSQPVQLELLLQDELESWSVPVSLDVDWVVPRVIEVEVTELEGNGDALLDPGELASLEITLLNAGDRGTEGQSYLSVSLSPDSAVEAEISEHEAERLGVLEPGDDDDGEYELRVSESAASGQNLQLLLTLQDDLYVYTTTLDIPLSETLWTYGQPEDDSAGDHYGSELDLLNMRYRVHDGQLEIIVGTAEPYDPSLAFLELVALGDGDYSILSATYQSGVTHLVGWNGDRFVSLATPSAELISELELGLSWEVSAMSLDREELTVGLGAGWCTDETGSYCDHYPEGWGHYYQSMSSSRMFNIDW